MMTLLLKSYFTILLSIGISALLILILGSILIYKLAIRKKPKDDPNNLASINQNKKSAKIYEIDFSAISGDDIVATQLDLAHAYIQAGKTQLAKKILEYVVKQGNAEQQEEARTLLGSR